MQQGLAFQSWRGWDTSLPLPNAFPSSLAPHKQRIGWKLVLAQWHWCGVKGSRAEAPTGLLHPCVQRETEAQSCRIWGQAHPAQEGLGVGGGPGFGQLRMQSQLGSLWVFPRESACRGLSQSHHPCRPPNPGGTHRAVPQFVAFLRPNRDLATD